MSIEDPTNEAEAKERKEQVVSTLYLQANEAMSYLDDRINLCLAFMSNPAPTQEEKDAHLVVLADLAAYSAGTLKRLIVVLGEMTRRPVDLV